MDVNHYLLQNNGKIGITATKASHYVEKNPPQLLKIVKVPVAKNQFNSILMSQVLPL